MWTEVAPKETLKLEKMNSVNSPNDRLVYKIAIQDLKDSLTPSNTSNSEIKALPILAFPDANGEMHHYQITEVPLFSNTQSSKYPNLKSYKGIAIGNSLNQIRFTLTPFGLHAILYSPTSGIHYIDTYTKDLSYYQVYERTKLSKTPNWSCLVSGTNEMENIFTTASQLSLNPLSTNLNNAYREFRLAMACTIEYAQFHINAANNIGIITDTESAKKEVVLAAMAVTMTRVNFIFERDLGIHLKFIDNNDDIIFIDSDNFTNNNASILIHQSQEVITDVIGSANFDIGHTVSTGAGGLANLYSPCRNNGKALGVTGTSAPVGDPFDVDFLAHELGHQFGANHSFNSSCSWNRNSRTAVEPGSGNSIMAYAGVCASEGGPSVNVQYNSTPFFHSISIIEINNFLENLDNCSVKSAHTTTPPIANAGEERFFPPHTPFYLEAILDPNQDLSTQTYSWEQIDNEISIQPPSETSESGPNFKFIDPTTSPIRYFPNHTDLIENNSTKWEVLPSIARTMNFRLLVRDNQVATGGQVAYANTQVHFVEGNPFEITYPNQDTIVWDAGTMKTVTWNVSQTDSAPFHSTHVDILYSVDNGANFEILSANTPNDGHEMIQVPDHSSDYVFILIQPTNSTFYTLSKKLKIINGTVSITDSKTFQPKVFPNPFTNQIFITLEAEDSETVQFTIFDLSGRKILQQDYPTKTSRHHPYELQTESFPKGLYILDIRQGNQNFQEKIIKH